MILMAIVNSLRLCACLMNVSEARRPNIVENIARAALKINKDKQTDEHSSLKLKSSVLNIFMDKDYNRSVITIVAPIDFIGSSVSAACSEAFQSIDLSQHHGGHPRLGAVDLVPIHPLSNQLSIDECGQAALAIAHQIRKETPGTSAFLFGGADLPRRRGLVARRKSVRWYEGKLQSSYDHIIQDVGPPPSARYGLTGIGAIPYVMNCNVTIETANIELGREIATSLRATSPSGFPGVQSMAFPHNGHVEIACNVEAIDCKDSGAHVDIEDKLTHAFGSFYYTSPQQIQESVRQKADEHNVKTQTNATIIGYNPSEAQMTAYNALSSGIEEFWKTKTTRMM